MSRPWTRPDFDEHGDVYARRDVTLGARAYQAGDGPIDWRKLAINIHQLVMLWEQGLIDTVPEGTGPQPLVTNEELPVVETGDVVEVPDDEDTESGQDPIPAADAPSAPPAVAPPARKKR